MLTSLQTAAAGDHRGSWEPIPDDVWSAMQGKSWHTGLDCPGRDELVFLKVPHITFNGEPDTGILIVARSAADNILDAFSDLHAAGFQIQRMDPVYLFSGSDDRSMDANNTSAFNCRLKTSGSSLSEHSFGKAIDINPIQNPYVKGNTTLPAAGRNFDSPEERAHNHSGMIGDGDAVVEAFEKIGWKWGGNWKSAKDYQHFSESGN
jgi:poly-gamma-glutamate synthesis protein (capsule biosynthesis protein)